MAIQTIFKAGNSQVVAIPKDIARELGLKVGQKVVVEKNLLQNSVSIKKLATPKSGRSTPKSSKEFQKWAKAFFKENGEILDELAVS